MISTAFPRAIRCLDAGDFSLLAERDGSYIRAATNDGAQSLWRSVTGTTGRLSWSAVPDGMPIYTSQKAGGVLRRALEPLARRSIFYWLMRFTTRLVTSRSYPAEGREIEWLEVGCEQGGFGIRHWAGVMIVATSGSSG